MQAPAPNLNAMEQLAVIARAAEADVSSLGKIAVEREAELLAWAHQHVRNRWFGKSGPLPSHILVAHQTVSNADQISALVGVRLDPTEGVKVQLKNLLFATGTSINAFELHPLAGDPTWGHQLFVTQPGFPIKVVVGAAGSPYAKLDPVVELRFDHLEVNLIRWWDRATQSSVPGPVLAATPAGVNMATQTFSELIEQFCTLRLDVNSGRMPLQEAYTYGGPCMLRATGPGNLAVWTANEIDAIKSSVSRKAAGICMLGRLKDPVATSATFYDIEIEAALRLKVIDGTKSGDRRFMLSWHSKNRFVFFDMVWEALPVTKDPDQMVIHGISVANVMKTLDADPQQTPETVDLLIGAIQQVWVSNDGQITLAQADLDKFDRPLDDTVEPGKTVIPMFRAYVVDPNLGSTPMGWTAQRFLDGPLVVQPAPPPAPVVVPGIVVPAAPAPRPAPAIGYYQPPAVLGTPNLRPESLYGALARAVADQRLRATGPRLPALHLSFSQTLPAGAAAAPTTLDVDLTASAGLQLGWFSSQILGVPSGLGRVAGWIQRGALDPKTSFDQVGASASPVGGVLRQHAGIVVPRTGTLAVTEAGVAAAATTLAYSAVVGTTHAAAWIARDAAAPAEIVGVLGGTLIGTEPEHLRLSYCLIDLDRAI